MRIPSKSDKTSLTEAEVPSEVRIWMSKGWTIVPSERRGFVLAGEKKMRSLDKIGLTVGVVLLVGFLMGFMLLGLLGVLLIVAALLDYKFNTKPPTKFFPEPGEKTRMMDRS